MRLTDDEFRDVLAHIKPAATWEHLSVPRNTLAKLKAICARFARGKSMVVLFAGPAGAGRTIAAEAMANDLQLDLHRIDLSAVVSKYIGETEKNLSQLFHESAASGAIVLFDEADALFGKRSAVKDSHDRYANIDTGLLLQRMESYAGIVILATNRKSNIDEAFLRRIRYVVELSAP